MYALQYVLSGMIFRITSLNHGWNGSESRSECTTSGGHAHIVYLNLTYWTVTNPTSKIMIDRWLLPAIMIDHDQIHLHNCHLDRAHLARDLDHDHSCGSDAFDGLV